MKFVFNIRYFVLFLIVFVIEILIALYMHDRIIRPYIGDVLAVVWVYLLVKSFTNLSPTTVAAVSFVFACLVEFAQYIHLVTILGIQNNKLLCTVLGTGFEWLDIGAYFCGALLSLTIYPLFRLTDAKKKRTLQVDVISGATLTSKTHLKALENALEQARVNE
jgi:hypothetical protein